MTDRERRSTASVGQAAATITAVLVGGFVGTGLRLGADLLLPAPADVIPVSTLAVNLLGSLLLGAAVARLWYRVPGWLRAGLGTGLLGSFTTFSAVVQVSSGFAASGEAMLALGYLAITVVGGLGAAALGLALGRPGGGWSRPAPTGPPEPIGPEE